MKKTFLVALAIVSICLTSFAADREHTLKVYNWADYISPEVLESFPKWYEEQTGEKIEIIYNTFDINENMLTEIEVGKEDYDVICPSEYIIERMLKENLLQKIDTNFGATPNYLGNVSPFVVSQFQKMAPNAELKVSDYTVGYMWGTTGFLYNPQYVSADDLESWGCITDSKFKGHIFMKDAFRDVYSVLVLYAYYDDILAGKVSRQDLVQNITTERIKAVENVLKQAKENVAGWEVDFGKEEMTKGKAWMNLSWSGDAQWAIDEAAEAGITLDYVVPKEGTNVWFDGWCIPIYAKNVKAASYWINYMCMAQNALLNMDEIGYVSVIGVPEVIKGMIDEECEPQDLSYFFAGDSTIDAHAVPINHVMYPDIAVINRSALMHDAAEHTEALLEMWTRVKGDNLNPTIIVVIVVVVLLIIFIVAYSSMTKRQRKSPKRKK